ncbi:MAG: acetyl-CoA carboxylase biotin carboxylase subunit [Bryobacterales bacterium]|nr:acetyl-CoA carboxylase biotin carboxylase subunit [Acidobacteriota bacterium]MCB9384799.1 acetyl-CoA carboxylase biotin carboxylase subunit [Bryobacterales bacterium]
MMQRVLIANRGEIALRVIAACKDLGIPTVAVYSQPDRSALHVRHADQALCIGPARSAESYLHIPAMISAAEITHTDAIHPGYGFLAENARFAEICEESGITFIGPSPEAIRLMGDKAKARSAMEAAGVPILPGSAEPLSSIEKARAEAERIGYPVILKASAGGGGRGMRIVRTPKDLERSFEQAQHEAEAAFQCGDVYLEKFIDRPRHIEFQVLGDQHGRVVSLGERECSVQRRHQKLIEEAPSPRLDAETRTRIGKLIEGALEKIGYSNAGTVEFLMDETGELHFIEMNARIQVEHPVTELVTGIDLVKAQIRVANGEPLSKILPEKIEIRGHAIECRVNAENPETFAPSAGLISKFIPPGSTGVRVDTAAYSGWFVPPYYDSLVAKLLTHGGTREEAITRMQRALSMFVVEGIHTSIPLHQRILEDAEFRAGRYDTHFIERLLAKKAEAA